ncbi:MAG: asparagine synthase (glutamine-hydrolyzing) [Rhizobiales bacterium 32-66-11]|nr:MAG: asparagine synthase (glutamine-hydrolyzing) [Rhizobiales bacterium 32-66-11]
MCGIVGHLRRHPGPAVPDDLIVRMADTLRHRGPDDEGFFADDAVSLGFRRLSIVDLAAGRQPMFAAEGRVVGICNGEIYNYAELRADLESRGHRFATRCDTELVPALFAEYGVEFARRINGQFAFAVFDRATRRLVLGRDQVGIAPLFYAERDGLLMFGSEIRALLSHNSLDRTVDLTALDQIFTFPGLVSPRTIFAAVKSLPPGHVLVADPDKPLKVQKYWDLDYPLAQDIAPRRLEECVEELDAALRQAVRYRLQADVPVGGYLSGGLDSSLIAAIVADVAGASTRHTFSITFPDRAMDERGPQRLMAKRLGTVHHEAEVDPSVLSRRLADIVRCAEAPLRESYNVCSLLLSGMVRDAGLKVVLTGEGADELFGGYVGYRLDMERGAAAESLDLDEMIEAEWRERLWGDPGFFYEKNYAASRENRQGLYADGVAARFDSFDCLAGDVVDRSQIAGRHPFHIRSYLDFKLRMADHLLADHGDRVSFANSVEARYPFLDIGVIDVARRIPPALMVQGGEEKYVLKQVARRYLPAEIVDRKKFSFVAHSSARLLRAREPQVLDLLDEERIRADGYFNPAAIAHLKTRYLDPKTELNQTFEDDFLMVVLTFGLLREHFALPQLS